MLFLCILFERLHSYDHLMAFWRLIDPATSRMIRVTSAREAPVSVAEKRTSNRSIKLLLIDELFLFLNYLSTGCTQRELGHQFNIDRTTASRIITTWANFLYCLLGAVCIWMSPGEITANLPPEFKEYADTKVIVDCTALQCQTPSSLVLQSEVYSQYKSNTTLTHIFWLKKLQQGGLKMNFIVYVVILSSVAWVWCDCMIGRCLSRIVAMYFSFKGDIKCLTCINWK